MKKFITLLATGFYSGNIRNIPGTMGSIVGLIIYFMTYNYVGLYIFLVIALVFLGVLVTNQAEKQFNSTDDQRIVFDEIVGMMVAMMLIPPTIFFVLAGFVLFRIFDIFKPYPISYLQTLPGGIGIMADDVAAGIVVNFILQIIKIMIQS